MNIYRQRTSQWLVCSLFLACTLLGCQKTTGQKHSHHATTTPYVIVLGIAQDAGYPQMSCAKDCCKEVWNTPEKRQFVSCLAIIDPASGQRWLIDATPDMKDQLRRLDEFTSPQTSTDISGVLLTHAHMGHYTGLMHLGREAVGASQIPVYAMPRMRKFLQDNGPWSQLIGIHNIKLMDLKAGTSIQLNSRINITAFLVPHRDEFSETVGFKIEGPQHSAIFIPDIDKWSQWETSIEAMIADVDRAYLDGTFYQNGEIPGRDMATIPHPFIKESIQRFSSLPNDERAKIHFIHLNHTNPALNPDSQASKDIEAAGYRIARQLETFDL